MKSSLPGQPHLQQLLARIIALQAENERLRAAIKRALLTSAIDQAPAAKKALIAALGEVPR